MPITVIKNNNGSNMMTVIMIRVGMKSRQRPSMEVCRNGGGGPSYIPSYASMFPHFKERIPNSWKTKSLPLAPSTSSRRAACRGSTGNMNESLMNSLSVGFVDTSC